VQKAGTIEADREEYMALADFINAKKKRIELPDFKGAPIADTHAHLDMSEDPARALARAGIAGVGLIVNMISVHENPEETLASLPGWIDSARSLLDEEGLPDVHVPHVEVAIGSHPHNASDYTPQIRERLIDFFRNGRIAGLGEIGLDYYYDLSPRDVQMTAFKDQMLLAEELDTVAILHIRDAHEQALEVLHETGLPKAGCVLHCFNLDAQVLKPFVDLGCHIAYGGPLTFKKSEEVRASASLVPRNRLLTETDSPFMAPEPCRGPNNEPALTVFTAAVLADSLGISNRECAEITYANACALFGCA